MIKQAKHPTWIYVSLIFMILALLTFTFLPLVSSFLQADFLSKTTTAVSKAQQSVQEKYEIEAQGYQVVLEREPDNQSALKGLINARLNQNDLKGSIPSLEKLAQLNPNASDYTLLLAQAKQQVGEIKAAEGIYRALLKKEPDNLLAIKGLSDLWLTQGQPQTAINFVKRYLSQARVASGSKPFPDLISLQLLLSEIYVSQKRFDEALTLYDSAIKIDKKDFRPLLAKSILLQQQGKTEEAGPLWQQAIDNAPVEYKDQIKQLAAQTESLLRVN